MPEHNSLSRRISIPPWAVSPSFRPMPPNTSRAPTEINGPNFVDVEADVGHLIAVEFGVGSTEVGQARSYLVSTDLGRFGTFAPESRGEAQAQQQPV